MKKIRESKKVSEKALRESLNKCWKLLNEKRSLKEDVTFNDMISRGMDVITKLKNDLADEIPGSDPETFNELVMNDSFELDTSEDDLDPVDGTLSESTKAKRKVEKKLQEGLGFRAALKAYIQQGGEKDMLAFGKWANENGFGDRVLDSVSKGGFNSTYNTLAGTPATPRGSMGATGAAPAVEIPPADPATYSNDLKNLIDLCNDGEQAVMDAATTVKFKYKQIHSRLKRVILGKSVNRYYLLMGDPGIGKSFIVRETLDALGYGDVPQITGSVGKTPAPVAAFLYQHKDDDIVILDDCDVMISNQASKEVSNMLKGALDPDRHHVTISPTIVKMASSFLKEQELRQKYKGDALFETEEEIEKRISESEEAEVEGEGGEEVLIPTDFDFNARIIFISNLNEDQVNPAVKDRCDKFELHLTVEEYMIRLGMIIANIDCGQKAGIYSEDEVDEAKALLMTVLASIIEAGNKGASLFGKRIVLVKGGLTFRLVKDLTESYIITLQDFREENPEVDEDTAKKICAKDWIRMFVLPRITA